MKKSITLFLILVFMFSICSGTLAASVNYAGGANHYFDTGAISKSGSSWGTAYDICYTCRDAKDSQLNTYHKSKTVNGSIALSNEVPVFNDDVRELTWTSGASSYSSAKLRLTSYYYGGNYYPEQFYFYATGRFQVG